MLIKKSFAAMAALSLSSVAMAQDAPDPITAIEGKWKGMHDDYEIEVKNGVVTLIAQDDRSNRHIPVGTVVARLSKSGRQDGKIYRYAGSQCLAHNGYQPVATWKFDDCGDFGAQFQVETGGHLLWVAGMQFARWQ